VEPIASHQDVTTIMDLLGRLQTDVSAIRQILEENDGEEETDPEADG
jgi:hypothetical protein